MSAEDAEDRGATIPFPPPDALATAAVADLLSAWNRRCSSTGVAEGPADDDARRALVVALEGAAAPGALARVRGLARSVQPASRSPETIGTRRSLLDEASSVWGTCVGSPGLVVEQLLLLRQLLAGTPEGDRIGRLVDRAMVLATQAATDELQRAAFSDPLTGCANRRALERELERELARCARAELDLSVVAIDVDGLKRVNDSEGHAAGDRLLLRLVETLRRALRGLDGVYRVGGDEFIVVLTDTSTHEATGVMARVEGLGAPAFSWGVASILSTGQRQPTVLLGAADDDLYERRRARRHIGRATSAVLVDVGRSQEREAAG